MGFRNLLAGALVAASLASPALAQGPDPETLAAARELAEISVPPGLVDQMIEQSWKGVEDMLRQSPLRPTPEKVAALKAEYVTLMKEEMTSSLSEAPAIFAKHLNAREMRDLTAFYRTESGKKMLAVTPTMMQELMGQMSSRLMGNMARFQEIAIRILGPGAGAGPK